MKSTRQKRSTDWKKASERAAKSGRWATTMTKWLITRLGKRCAWEFISFKGPTGRESTGIVDMLAIRKDHMTKAEDPLKRGDLLEIIVFQIKGGNAVWPTEEDVMRLRYVGKNYKAKAIILSRWKLGKRPVFYLLTRKKIVNSTIRSVWQELEDFSPIFA